MVSPQQIPMGHRAELSFCCWISQPMGGHVRDDQHLRDVHQRSGIVFFFALWVLEKDRTRHQQNVATWIIDCCSAVGGLAVSFNCWDCVFRQCWSYDIFFTRFSAIKQFSWQFKNFFHKINAPLYRCTLLYMCWYTYTHTHVQADEFTHVYASIPYSSSDKGDFLPHTFKTCLVLNEYPTILLSQTVLVCEEVFSNISVEKPGYPVKSCFSENFMYMCVCVHHFQPPRACPRFSFWTLNKLGWLPELRL